jgi:hypothetical protein
MVLSSFLSFVTLLENKIKLSNRTEFFFDTCNILK